MNTLPKFVVSTTLDQVEWQDSKLVKGNVVEEVSRLKEQPGRDILVEGSCQLVQTLLQHELVDELRLMIHPIVVGGGKRIFGDGTVAKKLRLVDSRTFGSGVVALVYQRAEK